MRKYPVGMVLNGRYYWGDGTLNWQGTYGYYWSSSAYTSATGAYNLYLDGADSAVYPDGSSLKRNGFSLRCLGKKGITTLKTLSLPTGNTTGEFQLLYNQYPTYDQMRKYPVGMVPGGDYYWDGSGTHAQGTHGMYWSNSAYTSSDKAYSLYMRGGSNTVYPAYGYTKILGISLRCLAQKENNNFEISFRLPTGGPSGEYQTLYNNYNSYTAMTDTTGPHFILSGYRNDTSPGGQGAYAYYWSSSAYTDATGAYVLFLNGTNSTVYPARYGAKRSSFPLRCLGKKGITTLKSPTPPNR